MKKEGRDFFHTKELMLVFPSLELTVSEAQRILHTYAEKSPGIKVDTVIISGGSAQLAGLDTYFSDHLHIPAVIGDPWRKINADKMVQPFLENMKSAYAVAIGLALRGIEEEKRR